MAEHNAIEPIPHDMQAAHKAHDDHDVTVIFGRTFNMPVYTAVFIALGILTALEVIVAEIFAEPAIRIPLLLGMAVVKAGLVMYFYMHLREDSRIFAAAILIPIAVALLAALFLMAVPSTGY